MLESAPNYQKRSSLYKLNRIWDAMQNAKDNGHFDYGETMALADQFEESGHATRAKEIRKWGARNARQ